MNFVEGCGADLIRIRILSRREVGKPDAGSSARNLPVNPPSVLTPTVDEHLGRSGAE